MKKGSTVLFTREKEPRNQKCSVPQQESTLLPKICYACAHAGRYPAAFLPRTVFNSSGNHTCVMPISVRLFSFHRSARLSEAKKMAGYTLAGAQLLMPTACSCHTTVPFTAGWRIYMVFHPPERRSAQLVLPSPSGVPKVPRQRQWGSTSLNEAVFLNEKPYGISPGSSLDSLTVLRCRTCDHFMFPRRNGPRSHHHDSLLLLLLHTNCHKIMSSGCPCVTLRRGDCCVFGTADSRSSGCLTFRLCRHK